MHCDMDNIDVDVCPELIQAFEAHQKRKNQDGDEELLIELPELKGHSNWTAYRDKFVANLAVINGSRNIPLLYVVDETDWTRITGTTPLFKVELIDLNDLDFYASSTTHTGPKFSEDNHKVWMLIKKSLLGH